nr:FAD:protein FMN transferase [Sphingomonas jinjuensis]
MGTTWHVLYAGHRDLRAAIEARLDALVAALSHWAPDSALSAFNRAPAGSWIALPPDLARVVDAGLRLAQASDGAFDPAIGVLVDAWGFGPPGACPEPDAPAIAAALARSGYHRLRWDGERLFQPGGVHLDLSGIAKGYAVDAVADLLADHGIRHCLVDIGGELSGRGMRPDGDPWWVDLEMPPGIALPPLRVALHQLAVATSGNYRRGEHTLDPRKGRPPDNGVVAVSVLASTAMLADALASAATVAWPDLSLLLDRDIAARVVIRDGDRVEEVLTPALRAMLDDDDLAAHAN